MSDRTYLFLIHPGESNEHPPTTTQCQGSRKKEASQKPGLLITEKHESCAWFCKSLETSEPLCSKTTLCLHGNQHWNAFRELPLAGLYPFLWIPPSWARQLPGLSATGQSSPDFLSAHPLPSIRLDNLPAFSALVFLGEKRQRQSKKVQGISEEEWPGAPLMASRPGVIQMSHTQCGSHLRLSVAPSKSQAPW